MSLDPAATVVRGGTSRDAEALLEKIADAIEDGDGAVLSVFCREQASDDLESLCRSSGIPHTKVQVTTVQRLQEAGFGLVHDPSDGQPDTHYHVVFSDPVAVEDVERFIECFDEPIPNPTGGKQRRR